MKANIPYAKKFLACIFHLVFLGMLIISICILYANSNFGRGFTWIQSETYIESDLFFNQLQSDIQAIFDYARLRNAFETDGELDMDKEILVTSHGPNTTTGYTLKELIDMGERYGYHIQENGLIHVIPSENVSSQEGAVLAEYKAYDPEPELTEPGQAYGKMRDLCYEALENFSRYSYVYHNLISSPSNLSFQLSCINNNNMLSEDVFFYTNVENSAWEKIKHIGLYAEFSRDSIQVETNMVQIPLYLQDLADDTKFFEQTFDSFAVSVDTNFPYSDIYTKEANGYKVMRSWTIRGMILMGCSIIGLMLSFLYLSAVCGYSEKNHHLILIHPIDQISAESCILLFTLLGIICCYLGKVIGFRLLHLVTSSSSWHYTEKLLICLIIYLISLVCFFSLLRRYKAHTLWKGSWINKGLCEIQEYFTYGDASHSVVYAYIVFVALNITFACITVYLFFDLDSFIHQLLFSLILLAWGALDLITFRYSVTKALQDDKINQAIANIASGDISYCVNLEEFSGKQKILADHINHIGKNLDTALQEKVKSERFKADLITNVSHDLKTPLTSIINYVDLIKREQIQNEKVQGYLDVLEQKSQRLKTLTEDLVEASKASSGNLKLEISDIDFVELIHQTNGEFEEKFTLRNLTLISNLPEHSILIEADGRRLWRVLENLYNNAFKYAMEYSRIYVDISRENDWVIFTIKNISQHPLNISSEELTERFVRGDVSRTTEGSGLGLSIAQSLTQLQKGVFIISIDGDLFKIQVKFPVKKSVDSGNL